jgi:hypothetical protein
MIHESMHWMIAKQREQRLPLEFCGGSPAVAWANGAETGEGNGGWQRQDRQMTAAPILSIAVNRDVNAQESEEYVNG